MIEHFHRPGNVREALALKKRFQGRAVFLAGGTYVNSNACALHPEHLISLAGLGLERIEVKPGVVTIGALCTLQRLIEDRRVPSALQAAAALVVSRNVREAATLGGHVAGNLPSSDVIPMLVALGAKVGVSRPGAAKTILVEDYVKKPAAGLLTKIIVPRPKAGRVAVCRTARASANARSVVSVALCLTIARAIVKDPVIALSGVAGHVVRLTSVEEALDGKSLPATDELQALVSRSVRPAADLTGSAAFRRYQAGTLVALALQDALQQKRGRS